MEKTIEIPEGYEARIEGNKVILEPKESEDESIRQYLIRLMRQKNQNVPMVQKALAYLERQKEQKSAECISIEELAKHIKAEFESFRNLLKKKGIDYRPADIYWTDYARLFVSSAKKLQNPAEWNENDKNKLYQVVEILLADKTMALRENPHCKALHRAYHELIDFLKSLPERFNLQPRQEWSEEYREEDLRTRFAFYTYKNEEDDGILYLSNVFVEETSRNKGFGTKILAAAEKVAETIGAITIRLKVKQDSPANAWYRKHGYGYMTFEDGYDWLEKTLEYLKSTKQKWNEEDVLRIRKEEYSRGLNDGWAGYVSKEWSEEDEKILTSIIERGSSQVPFGEPALREEQMEWLMNRLKSLSPQPKGEIYKSAKHDLAIRFMNYLDENRPDGKMSLSSGECEDIDKAFKENDWAKIMRYVEKYSASWKPSNE